MREEHLKFETKLLNSLLMDDGGEEFPIGLHDFIDVMSLPSNKFLVILFGIERPAGVVQI